MTCSIQFGGEQLDLLAERAVFRPAEATLLIADLHLGKGEVFRRQGIPVPTGTTMADLARLDRLVDRLRPDKVVILGDLAHAAPRTDSPWVEQFSAWLFRRRQLTVEVIAGNHDRGMHPPANWPLVWHENPCHREGIVYCHEPENRTEIPAVCGHLHPTVSLVDGRERLRLACFMHSRKHLVLPAFGQFTGGHDVRPGEGKCYAIVEDEVIAVPTPLK